MTDKNGALFHPSIPSDLLGDDPHPINPQGWDAIVLRAATAHPLYTDRETLHFAAAVASMNQTGKSDIGRRYVRSYLSRLSVGLSGDRCDLAVWRGLVCEMTWLLPSVNASVTKLFRVAVGNPDCGNWSAVSPCIQERVVAAINASDRLNWRTFPLNMCAFNGHNAEIIQQRLCMVPATMKSFHFSCSRAPGSPHWCQQCELNCQHVLYTSVIGLVFIVVSLILCCVHYYTMRNDFANQQ